MAMHTQKLILKLQQPGVEPIDFLAKRTWPMTGIQIENVLQHVFGRLPTKEEVEACKPDRNFEDKRRFHKVHYESKYGKL